MKIRYLSILIVCLSVSLHAKTPGGDASSAVSAVRDFMRGYYLKDEAALKRALPAGTDLKPLLDHPDLESDKQAPLRIDIESIQLGKSYPSAINDPSRAIVTFKMGEAPWLLPVFREAEAWKVDPRYALAARASFDEKDPRGVVQRFILAVFQKDKKALASIVLLHTEKELDAMLKENKLSAEDRDPLSQLASMMPMASTHTGEELRYPNGEVRTALNDEAEQTYLGLIGFSELPFRVRKVEGLWKVVPQPYVPALKAVGMVK